MTGADKDKREKRLAEALRRNLRRRKAARTDPDSALAAGKPERRD